MVIAILATISIVAFNGVQVRARDAERQTDTAAIQKVLEMYYIDNGTYPYYEDMMNSTWRKNNLSSTNEDIFINPSDTGSSNSMNGSGGGVAVDKYSFYSTINSGTTVCRRSLMNGPCTGYRMAWRLEQDSSAPKYKNADKD